MSLTKISNTFLSDNIINGFSFRNILINGAMNIAQRSQSVTNISSGGYYTADRWVQSLISSGTWTQSVEADAPLNMGLRKSLRVQCISGNNSLPAESYNQIVQRIEGQNLQSLKKGTTSVESLSITFWVKSNLIGNYICELSDVDNNRTISVNYQINASGTWEKKTITIPGDMIGALDNDNMQSLALVFWLSAGSNYNSATTLNSVWSNNTITNRAVGQVNLSATINNYFQITGVQMEIGAFATTFENRPYDVELIRCMRYYEVFGCTSGRSQSATQQTHTATFSVNKRAIPNISLINVSPALTYDYNGTSYTINSINNFLATTSGLIYLTVNTSSGLGGGNIQLGTNQCFSANSEL